jgi:hypothetical protein
MNRLSCTALLMSLVIKGFSSENLGPLKLLPSTEAVMSPGMKITVNSRGHVLTVGAEEGAVRTYTWSGATRRVRLAARTERWYGSLGLYQDADFKAVDGITRGVLQEGQMHFRSEDAAVEWLTNPYNQKFLEYTKTGLAAGWYLTPLRQQINVDVWQIYIEGKKPSALRGG